MGGGAEEVDSTSGPSARARVRIRWAASVFLGAAIAIAVDALIVRTGVFEGGAAAALPSGLLAGWTVLTLVNTAWALFEVWPMNAEQTRVHATAEDPGHSVARLVAVVGSLASLAAVVTVIVQIRNVHGPAIYALAGLALLSVFSSWALIQTDYMLRYARVYYEAGADGEPSGGIDFNQEEPPEYTDFAYFSVGLGMTYQVADTSLTRNAMRRIAIAQTLLAYLFGAGILAVAINLVAGLG